MLFGLSLLLSAVLGSANAVLKRVTFLACFIFRFLRRPLNGLTAELMEGHLREHVLAAESETARAQAVDELSAVLRTYVR